MANKFPLIVNSSAGQIQEIQGTDDLELHGQLKLTGTASGGSDILLSGGTDGHAVLTVTGHNSNVSKLTIDGRVNAGGSGTGSVSMRKRTRKRTLDGKDTWHDSRLTGN